MGIFSNLLDPGHLITRAADFAGRIDPIGAKISSWEEVIPGSPAALRAAMRMESSGNPYGPEASAFDVAGGGTYFSQDPDARRIGRTVGSLAAAYFGAGALGAGGGGGTNLALQGGEFYGGAEGWPAWATEGGGMYGGGAGTASISAFPTGNSEGVFWDEAPAYNYDYDAFPELYLPQTFEAPTYRGTVGDWSAGSFAPGERGGMPREVWEDMMRRNRRMPLLDIASGIYGMTQARGIRREAERADPMSAYRGQYAAQLAALAANPNLITSMPGYQAGLTAVERRLAAQGYLGSGNMMIALANQGGEFYNREMARLAGLATPSPGAIEARVGGRRAAADLTGRSLASIGRGIYNF